MGKPYCRAKFSQVIWKFPLGKFVISDSAYDFAETLLTPFSGKMNQQRMHSIYLSQLRICIEQTFGIMTEKWRILRQQIWIHLKNFGKLFMWITRLHNFCINEGCVLPTNADDKKGNETGFIPSDILKQVLQEILCFTIS